MFTVGPIAGSSESYDYQVTAGANALLHPGIVSGFSVVPGGVLAGKALLRAVRTNGQEIVVFVENDENTTVDTSGTKKVWIELDQDSLDDGSENALDGSNIASIATGASYPAANYVPLASIISGAITDDRVLVGLGPVKRHGLGAWKVMYTDGSGTEQEVPLGAAGTALVSAGASAPPSFQVPTVARISGEIIAWPTNTPPTGWLLCDGSWASRSTHASLFAVIGTTYGPGDGSTTFNLPNLLGRVIVGRDSGQTEFDVLGETGGAKTHTLSIGEMPSHSHNVQRPSGAAVSSGYMLSSQNYDGAPVYQATQTAGSGQAHNNLQPYVVLNYIIKI